MHIPALAGVLACTLSAGCHSYAPAPVDLEQHGRLLAERVPGREEVLAFVAELRRRAPELPAFDLADGLSLAEGRYVALLCNPDLEAARLRAGVARAAADHAGRWSDPELRADFARILQRVDHRWLAGGALGVTIPITGRPGLEREVAEGRHAQALVVARLAEAEVLDALDLAWVRWSAAALETALLQELIERLAGVEATAARLVAANEVSRIGLRAFTLAKVARQLELLRAQAVQRSSELEVKRLLGLPPDRPLLLAPTTRLQARVQDPDQRRARLRGSPRVVLAQREHGIAERQLALAVRKQWPELTLFPGFQEEDAQPRAALGFSLPLPLWNRNVREIAEATAGRAAAAQALRGTLERATQDLARAEVQWQAAQEQRALVEAQLVPLAEQQLADARRLADLGQLDTLLILDSIHRSYEARHAAVAAAVAEAQAIVELNAFVWPALAPEPAAGEPAGGKP